MIQALDHFREYNIESVVLRLFLAMLLGGVLGLERGRKRRPAGFRTYILVSVGTALTMILGQYDLFMMQTRWAELAKQVGVTIDISRFGAQVINGIGFLGAGTVLVTGRQQIKGLTTAAGLWASACMGLAIGAGFYECVFFAFLMILIVACVLPVVEKRIIENSRYMSIYVEFSSLDDLGAIIAHIKRQDVSINAVDVEKGGKKTAASSAVFSLYLNQKQMHATFLTTLSGLKCIRLLEEVD